MASEPTRVLLVLTSHDKLGDTGSQTGFYVPEAAHPWHVFQKAGYDVSFASTLGGQPPATGFDPADDVQQQFMSDESVQAALKQTAKPSELEPSDYAAVFYVGGHGTMWDFPDDANLAAFTRRVYERDGVVAAVCHGPAGLVNLTLSDGSYLVSGKEVAAFTDEEEAAVELTAVVPFLLARKLQERGARHTKAPTFQPHVVVSGRLVTGQNPASATGVAEEVVRLLDG